MPPSTTPLPAHLDDLYQRASLCLEEAQKAEVAALLSEFANVFAPSANGLGSKSILKHKIQTNESKPIQGSTGSDRGENTEHAQAWSYRTVIQPMGVPNCSAL